MCINRYKNEKDFMSKMPFVSNGKVLRVGTTTEKKYFRLKSKDDDTDWQTSMGNISS